jgi:hypothetical protein
MCTDPPVSSRRSLTLRAAISETRAPVLYMRVNRTRSRNPARVVVSGASSNASTCLRVMCLTVVRSKRLLGIASTRCAT